MRKRSLVTDRSIMDILGPMEDLGFFREKNLMPILASTTDFSVDTAWWMSELSRLAYVESSEEIFNILINDGGFNDPKFFIDKETGTFAFIVHTINMVIVVFRGTQISSMADIKTDLNVFLTSENKELKTRVHRGFKAGLDSIWPELKLEIEKLQTNGRHIYFTGHSLGAALATLAGSRMNLCDKVYAFGSPCVGNSKFVKNIKAKVFRISRTHDIVTRIPPTFIGYRHAGDDYFIKSNGELIKNPSYWIKLKERLGGSELKILFLILCIVFTKNPFAFFMNYLRDHSPYNYSVLMWNNSSINI